MKKQEQTQAMVLYATKAMITALEYYEKENPGKYIVKQKLFPVIASRARIIMNIDEYADVINETVPPPDESFIKNHWSAMGLLAADQFKKYVVYGRRNGVRLGSFEEYQHTRIDCAQIAKGIAHSIDKRDYVIVKQGGSHFSIGIIEKQLGAGDSTTAE